MPHMSGLELAQNLLQIRPDMKIVLMTAFEIYPMELKTGLPILKHTDILKKPFRLVEHGSQETTANRISRKKKNGE